MYYTHISISTKFLPKLNQMTNLLLNQLSVVSREQVFSITRLTRSHAPHCSLRSRAPVSSFAHSIALKLTGKMFMSLKNALISECFYYPYCHVCICHCSKGTLEVNKAGYTAADASGSAISLIPATRLCACICVCAHACVFVFVAITCLRLR